MTIYCGNTEGCSNLNVLLSNYNMLELKPTQDNENVIYISGKRWEASTINIKYIQFFTMIANSNYAASQTKLYMYHSNYAYIICGLCKALYKALCKQNTYAYIHTQTHTHTHKKTYKQNTTIQKVSIRAIFCL